MSPLFNKIFNIKKALIGNDEFVKFIESYDASAKIHKFKSGTNVYDWHIPKKWNVKRGILKDLNNNIILDYKLNNLNLLTHSDSFVGKISREDLENHLFYKEDLPSAIPWMHSYYKKNWGFCLSKKEYETLSDDHYYVDIQTDFEDDFLNIAEFKIKGRIEKEVILTTYTCHPYMASDNSSGIYMLLKLYKSLKHQNLKYTYRFFFFPETIGSLTLLSQGIVKPENTEYCLIATCVGHGQTINYKRTHENNHSIDNIVENILDKVENKSIRNYSPCGGSDERQFSSPKVRIPTGTIMRAPYSEYSEYHTSLDNLDLISCDEIDQMVDIHEEVLLEYEKYSKFMVCHDGGEPFLTRYNMYRNVGGTHKHYDHEFIRNWVLFLSDGKHNIKDISRKSKYKEKEIKDMVDILLAKRIIEEV